MPSKYLVNNCYNFVINIIEDSSGILSPGFLLSSRFPSSIYATRVPSSVNQGRHCAIMNHPILEPALLFQIPSEATFTTIMSY